MKFYRLQVVSFLFLILSFTSCNKNDEIETLAPTLLELQFSNPPIELQGLDVQFVEDIPYDEYSNTKFDIFLPNSSSPTGLVVFIHGGGFTGGDKSFIYTSNYEEQIIELLTNNFAVATINYRLIENGDSEGVLKSLNDSKRAVQYLRYIHRELNIDKDRIGLFGTSAGASTALWIAANDDLKSNNNADPVLQESTRVQAIALRATQSSLDIENRWVNDVFSDFGSTLDDIINEFGEELIFNFYGISSWDQYETPEIVAYRHSIDMLSLLSSDDPDIWVNNISGHNNKPATQSSFNHHPFHAREIKEFADAVGINNVISYGKPIIFTDPADEGFIDFFLKRLN